MKIRVHLITWQSFSNIVGLEDPALHYLIDIMGFHYGIYIFAPSRQFDFMVKLHDIFSRVSWGKRIRELYTDI